MKKPLIFLGGTTDSKYKDWRKEYIIKLKTEYELFNPVVDEWNEEAKEREDIVKETADILLFYICGNSLYSIAELVDCSNKCPERTVVVFDKEEMLKDNTIHWKNVIAIMELVTLNKAIVFENKKDSIDYLMKRVKEN